jgi:hypothetical protein
MKCENEGKRLGLYTSIVTDKVARKKWESEWYVPETQCRHMQVHLTSEPSV